MVARDCVMCLIYIVPVGCHGLSTVASLDFDEGSGHPEAVAAPVSVLDLNHVGAKLCQLRRDERASDDLAGGARDAAFSLSPQGQQLAQQAGRARGNGGVLTRVADPEPRGGSVDS